MNKRDRNALAFEVVFLQVAGRARTRHPRVLAWYTLAGRYQHPVGTGPAGPSVDPGRFAQVWSRGRHVLLGVGDIKHASSLLPRWPDGKEALRHFDETIAEVCASYPNVEDPNDQGYDAIRRCFLNTMAEVLGPAKD